MTSPSSAALIRTEIAALPDYNAGLALDQFRARYGRDALAKVDSNENPFGPSPAAIEQIRAAAAGVGRYPDAGDTALRQAIAARTGRDAETIILGNGSEDLIGAIYRATLRPGDRVVTICPSFGLHEFGALSLGAVVEKVPFPADWRFPVDGLIQAMAQPVRILIFSSPSNPAGPAISQGELTRLLAAVPEGTLIVFDEAYREYLEGDLAFEATGLLDRAGHAWISLRTFSKAYGLAGARVGYGLCSDSGMARALRKTRNPFAVNALAGVAALAALADDAHLDRTTTHIRAERKRIAAALTAMGIEVAPSQGNFLFFRTRLPGAQLAEALRHQCVLIKGWQESPFLDWARVTVALAEENDSFLKALPMVL